MADHSRDNCGFEGTAQQLPWTKAWMLLRATYLDLSWSLTSLYYPSGVFCSCWFYMYMRNAFTGWGDSTVSHCTALYHFVDASRVSERIHEASKVVSQRSCSLYAHPQIFSWDGLLEACVPPLPHKIQIAEQRWLLLQRALFTAQWLYEVAG